MAEARRKRYGPLTIKLRDAFQTGEEMDAFLASILKIAGLDDFDARPDFDTTQFKEICPQIDAQIATHQMRELTECLYREMKLIRMMMAAKLSEADADTQMLFAKIDHNAERIVAGSTLPAFIRNARMNVIDELVMVMNHGGKTQAQEKMSMMRNWKRKNNVVIRI